MAMRENTKERLGNDLMTNAGDHVIRRNGYEALSLHEHPSPG
jgi:hypothetical protein